MSGSRLEIHLTSEEGYDLSTSNGVSRVRQAVSLAERESRKISDRTRRKQADRARNGQAHGGHRCFGYKTGNMEVDEAEASVLREMGSKLLDNYSFKEIAYWAMVVERIDVFPGIGKPFVNVDGVTMRFDKNRVMITWRKVNTTGLAS